MTQGYNTGIPIDTDPLMTSNSDLLVPSQKAVVSYLGTHPANLTGPVTSVGVATSITNLAITNAMIAVGTIDLSTKVTGTLPVANGGTGVTSSTGTVAVVLSNTPTLVTPVLGAATGTSLVLSGLLTAVGNVGIGTVTTRNILTVRAPSATRELLSLETNDFVEGSNTGSSLVISFGASSGNTYTEFKALSGGVSAFNNLIFQSAGGAVGIGNSSPGKTLDVTGTFRVSSTATFSGLVDATGQLTGKGTATNDNAAAGYIGEYIESVISTLTNWPVASATWGNLTSISLTAGDWDVTGLLLTTANGATITGVAGNASIALSVNSGTTTTDHVPGSNQLPQSVANASADRGNIVSEYRLSLSGTTTVYFKGIITFSVATPQYQCRISARRMR